MIVTGPRLAGDPKASSVTKTSGLALTAMVQQRGGDPTSAAASLNTARLMADRWQASADKLATWWDWMIATVLIRKAEQLIEPNLRRAK